MKDQEGKPGLSVPMRIYLAAAASVVVLAIGTVAALAQTAVSESNSNSNASVNANTSSGAVAQSGTSSNNIRVRTGDTVANGGTAQAAGGSVYIAGNPTDTRSVVEQRGGYSVKQSGTTTIRSAPAVQAPSMGSGHPCAMSGSVGISIIGGGISGGAMKIDEACLLAQMGQGEAALIMIARRDPEACQALRSVGRIPAASRCTNAEKRAPAARVATPVRSVPRCPEGSSWDGKGCWMPAHNRR